MDTQSARELRSNLTDAERCLWNNDVLANTEAVAQAVLDAVEKPV